ncbi:MAG: 3-methylmercaptopropionyl-CoA ligase of DmdB1 type [uncultured Rubrobacteraceae bacterium]|uniref:3-methylmercaptopropionyl-CoA ligase of DmdB1 type n=1 Tax=uncultured Rubrobacteraceae bacterium TaxID=349277 RepID=A0A6J4QU95_9ACTN|nr:MAG: 3-methylmercaptopropionyl-CoA ligase of DmdB1 type [uncultured Rubrobacteraceae bacterium]
MQEHQEKVYRDELTPVSFLRRSAHVFPEKVAVVHGDRRYTYREFEERVNRLASRLRDAGLQKGDRVAFLAPNIPPLLEAHFAVPASGCVLVPINTRLGSEEVGHILEHSGSKMLFVDAELEKLVEPLDTSGIEIVRIDDTGEPGDPYEDYLADGSPETLPSVLEDEEETIAINYTSGTTGKPKGAMYSHRGAYLNALGVATGIEMNSRSVYLWILPMFHCDGWCFPWGVTSMAATHVCLRKVEPDKIWDLLEAEGVTHYCAAPTVQIGMVNHEKAHRMQWEVATAIGGAPPSPTLLGQFQDLNIRPIHLYGLTETYGPATICAWHEDWDELSVEEQAGMLARQGQAHVISHLARVVDEEMNDVPRDGETLGEIVTRGNTVMKGYLNNEEATQEAFKGGWYHSGDVAVWHPDGYVEIRDRSKDVIISGGENISSIEIEQVVDKHPAVLECAVVAIPDEKWGERPKAFVALKEGKEATEQEIIDFCKERMARFKAPAAVEFGDLPKTSTGKVQKFVLRDKEWAGQAKRVG